MKSYCQNELCICGCGREFKKSGRKRYYSNACKQKHYRNRKCYDSNIIPIARPLLRYHGGKWRLAKWIHEYFPSHVKYVEPFAGAASVLLRKKRVPIEVLNDKHDRLVNLLRVVSDPQKSKILSRQLELTLYSETEYLSCREASTDLIEDARRMIVLGFQSHGSTGASGGKLTGWRRGVRSAKSHSAKEWVTLPEQISQWCERLKGVYIECGDATDVMRRWDSSETLFYVDPPYLFETRSLHDRGYKHEMENHEHKALAKVLKSLKGFVIISGYPSILYNELYSDWEMVEKKTFADMGKKVTEVLWLSTATSAKLSIDISITI